MAKQYWELYEEVSKLKPKTQAYYRAVSKLFKITIDKDALMRVREFRKNEAYKKGKTLSQAYKEYDAGVKYENAAIQRAYDIWSGAYFEKMTNRYADNYLKALKTAGMGNDIIEFLSNNKEIIKMGAMPPITEFYIPSKEKGEKYDLNIDNTGQLEASIREFLREAWGADL